MAQGPKIDVIAVDQFTKVLKQFADAFSTSSKKAAKSVNQVDTTLKNVGTSASEAGRKLSTQLKGSFNKMVSSAKSAGTKIKNNFKKSFNNIKAAGKKLGASLKSSLVNAAAGFLAVAGVKDLMDRLIEIEPVTIAFDSMAASIGESSSEMLASVKEATRGIVPEFNLMKAANQAITLGVVRNKEEFADLAGSAVRLGRALGLNATKAVEDITTALGRQSILVLDNLGITFKLSEAYKEYAGSIGKATKDLTDSEKKLAFQSKALKELKDRVDSLGDPQETVGEKIEKMSASFQNLQDTFAGSIDSFGFIFDFIATGVDEVTKNLPAMGTNLARFFVEVARGVLAMVRFVVGGLEDLVNAGINAVNALLEAADAVNPLGDGPMKLALANFTEGIDDAEQSLADIVMELVRQGEEAKKAASGNKALAEALKKIEKNAAGAAKGAAEVGKKVKEISTPFDNAVKSGKDFIAIFDKLEKQVGTGRALSVMGKEAKDVVKQFEILGKEAPQAIRDVAQALQPVTILLKKTKEEVANLNDEMTNWFGDIKGEIKDLPKIELEFDEGMDELPKDVGKAAGDIGKVFSKAFAESVSKGFTSGAPLSQILTRGLASAVTTAVNSPQFQKSLKQMGINISGHLASGIAQAVTIGMTSIAQGNIGIGIGQALGGSIGTGIGSSLGGPFGAQIGSILGSTIGGALAKAFSGPTNEELMAQYGKDAAIAFGDAWSKEVEATMQKVAEKLPKAGSGKFDFVAAMFHPDTVDVALKGLDSFTAEIQNRFANMFEDDVKSVLINTLKLSEGEAAQAMAPLFETAIQKAIEFGEALTPEMQRMFDWAKKMGAEINVSADRFTESIGKLINSTNISTEQFQNLRDLAIQVGVDIDEAFSMALATFIEQEDFSIEKLKGIALAASEAGFSLEEAFSKAVANSKAKIGDLRSQLQDIGTSALDWFLEQIEGRQGVRKFKADFIDSGASQFEKEWEKANAARKRAIEQLSGVERKAAEERFESDRAKAFETGREKSQIRYEELLKKANAINIDGKHDIRDIREAIKGLPEEEQKVILELAKQKQERIAQREEMKRQRELQKQLRKQIKAEKDLLKGINQLAKDISKGFSSMGDDLPQTNKDIETGFQLQQQWRKEVELTTAEYKKLAVASAVASGAAAAVGVSGGPVTNNYTIQTDNPAGFSSYLASGGDTDITETQKNTNKFGGR